MGKNDSAKSGTLTNVNIGENNFCTSILDDSEIVECSVVIEDEECCFLPFEHKGENPLDLVKMQEEQLKDKALHERAAKHPDIYAK